MPSLIPRQVLFSAPARGRPQLSPSGCMLAFIAPDGGAPNIWVGDHRTGSYRPVTRDPRGLRGFAWAGSRYLVYGKDRDGDENTHVHAVDLVTGETRDLTPFEDVQAGVLRADPRVPGALLLGIDRGDGRQDAYHADLATGALTLAARNQGFTGWLAGPGLEVRGAIAPEPGGGAALLVRDGGGWQTVYRVGYDDVAAFLPCAFTADGDAVILISSRDAQAGRVVRLDLASGAVTVLYEDPDGFDVTSVDLDPVTREPRLALVRRQRRDLEVLDRSIAADIAGLRSRCRGDLALHGRDAADRLWLVHDNVDDGPASYYLFDRADASIRFLFDHAPELAEYQLAPMEPFEVTARDGLRVRGYLTYPRDVPRRNLPTVLVVHGGPWARDVWGLRAEPQWLANRGYLCVNVNYRGSTGFGRDFVNAGDREWGGRMQDDLTDVLAWLVTRGIADPGRLAIFGASYGGYAALVGATFTPGLFRCAISHAGPSNLRTFLAAIPASWKLVAEEMYRRVGHPVHDAAWLWSRSPLSRVDQIRIPVLISQGANDPRVRRQESEQIVAAMRERGIPHEYLLFPDEGHGFMRPENRLAFYAAAERFLAEHLGGLCETGGDEVAA